MGISARRNNRGFTVVELMIATMIFGVVILISSAAMIMLGRQFYKGILSSKTQEINRQVVDEIGRNIQFTGANPAVRTNGNVTAICVSEKEYLIEKYRRVTGSQHAVLRFENCHPTTPIPAASISASWAGDTGTELLSEGMRVSSFGITNLAANARAWKLDLAVLSGDDEIARDTNSDGQMDSCKGGAGSEFCASSSLSVTVFKPL